MQGHRGWEAADSPCMEANTRHWQGQWELPGDGDGSSGWGASNWDQLGDYGKGRSEEFENIMQWDDSGALDAFETARRLDEELLNGRVLSATLPSPDLYIQAIDWDSHEDLKLPDPSGTISPPRKGQRKRGSRGNWLFRRQFDREEISHVTDLQQSRKPFPQSAYRSDVKAEPEKEPFDSPAAVPLKPSDSLPKACPKFQSNKQDQTKRNWTSVYQKQSTDWSSHGKSFCDEPQDLQFCSSQRRWRQTNNQSGQARWGHGGTSYQRAQGLTHTSYSQAAPVAQGNDWMPQQEANVCNLGPPSPLFEVTSCSRQQHVPSYGPDKMGRWRPPRYPNHGWH